MTDDEVIHEACDACAYRDIFDGVTKCERYFLRRDDRNSAIGVWNRFTPASLTPRELDWVLVSRTEKRVTCVGCIGDHHPWTL